MMILLFLISGAFAGALFRTIKEVMNLNKEIRHLHSAVEEHDGLIQANIDNTVCNGIRIENIETDLGLNQDSCSEECYDRCFFCSYSVESDI